MYSSLKDASQAYQTAKQALLGEGGPFSGWVRSGKCWKNFNLRGESQSLGLHLTSTTNSVQIAKSIIT